MKKFILNLLSIFDKSFWHLEVGESSNKRLLSFEKSITPNHKKINLKTLISIRKGWYLYGIKYFGCNKFVIGNIYLNNSKFNQGRPMNSSKYRWRIIRINSKNNLRLILNNVSEDIYIKNIWLIKIPTFEAWRRIYKKVYSIKGKCYSKKQKKVIWYDYNKIFTRKIGDPKQEEYLYWISHHERSLIREIRKKKYHENKFRIIRKDQVSKVDNDEWAIIILEEGKLSLWALDSINYALAKNKNCNILYTDEDCISESGIRSKPYFKTSWNKELFISNPYYSGIWIIKGELWNRYINGSFKNLYTAIYEIILNLDNTLERKIFHLSIITFHRFLKNKKSLKPLASKETLKVIKNCLEKGNNQTNKILDLNILPDKKGYQTVWAVPKHSLLSIIIPTKNNYKLLHSCIKSIYTYSPNVEFEIIIINNNSDEESTKIYFESLKNIDCIRIIDIPGKFNYSKINNNASKIANGNVILFLNNDIQFLKSNWGGLLVSNALRDGVGCVGAKLIYEDGTIQHSGVILGIGGVAGHCHKNFDEFESGYKSRLILTQEFSALTGACLAISKANFNLLNGFNERDLRVNYNDVDLCLRAYENGLKNIFLPNVFAIHHESKTRGRPKGKSYIEWKQEFNWMKKRWLDILENDPAYNPNLSLIYEDFSIGLDRTPSVKIRNMFLPKKSK